MRQPLTNPPFFDVAVIGAGIVGAMTALLLSRMGLGVIVLERGADPAGATKANSGIIHPGYDPEPGTTKARLGLAGARAFEAVARSLGIPFRRTGSLMLAFDRHETDALQEYLARGRTYGLQGLAIWGRDEVLAREPAVNPAVVAALYAPDTAVTSPFEAAVAAVGEAVAEGATAWREAEVTAVKKAAGGRLAVATSRGEILAGRVVNAAGLEAGRVAALAGLAELPVRARNGEYLVFDREVGGTVGMVIYPVPTPFSKGILVLPTVHGNLLIGPNAADLTGAESGDPVTAGGLDEVIAGARRLVPGLPLDRVIAGFSGTRAVMGGDFAIGPSPELPALINAAGISSPGLTASPAIAAEIAFLVTGRRPPAVRPGPVAREGERVSGRRGRIVCRCEGVDEEDVVAAIRAPFGAYTVDGVKQRTRAGMGRCQGAFCAPRVVEILSRELGLLPAEITKSGAGSLLFAGRTKEGTPEGGPPPAS